MKVRRIKMSEILFYLIQLIIAVVVLLATKYAVPYLKEKIGTEQLLVAEKWAKYAVLTAQQTLTASSGTEKKTYVTDFLKELLRAKDISLTDEQLNVLIESAVKAMKMEDNT
jgi:LL-H family phage holin